MNLKNACVEVSKSRSMHVWLKLCNKFETWSVPGLCILMRGGQGWAMVFSYQSRSMRVVLDF